MRLQPKKLRVYPNPWGVDPRAVAKDPGHVPSQFTLDAVGRACGSVMQDPGDGRVAPSQVRMVGARFDARTRITDQPAKGDNLRSPRQETVFAFMGESAHETRPFALADALATKTPIELESTRYYLDRIRDGSLLPADETTARAAEVKFLEPKVLFRKIAEAAARGFDAQYEGDAAYQHFCDERASEAEPEPKDSAPPKEVAKPRAGSAKKADPEK